MNVHRFILPGLFGLWVLAALLPSVALAGETPIPGEAFDRLDKLLLAHDDDRYAASERVRRLRSVLLFGRQLEREHPDAPNLYRVRKLMIDACKGLLMLGVADAPREEMLRLVRQVAGSENAPPRARIEADQIVLQLSLSEVAGDKEKTKERIEEFIRSYEDTPVAPLATMMGATLARRTGLNRYFKELVEVLEIRYIDQPGVTSYLRAFVHKAYRSHSPMTVRLPLLRGEELHLPGDLLGKTTLMIFWSVQGGATGPVEDLKAFRERHADEEMAFVGISVDPSVAKVKRFIEEHRIPWPQSCSGKGPDDPTLQYFGRQSLPSYWVIDIDGRVRFSGARSHHRSSWRYIQETLRDLSAQAWRRRRRLQSALSGEFALDLLCDRIAGDGNTPPALGEAERQKLRHAVRHAYYAQVREDKARGHRALIDACRAARDRADGCGNATLRTMELASHRWLALNEIDPGGYPAARALGEKVLEDTKAGPLERMVAALAVLDARIVAHELTRGQIIQAIRGWEREHLREPPHWTALVGRMSLHMRAGLDEYRRDMFYQPEDREVHPRLGGIRREVLGYRQRRPRRLEMTLRRLDDDRELRLPDDLAGSTLIVHFWTMDAPPDPRATFVRGAEWGSAYGHVTPSRAYNLEIVGVNLDDDPAAVREYLAGDDAPRFVSEWTHTYLPGGFSHPDAIKRDIQVLPSAWSFLPTGELLTDSSQLGFKDELNDAMGLIYHASRRRERSAARWDEQWLRARLGMRYYNAYPALVSSNWTFERDNQGKYNQRVIDLFTHGLETYARESRERTKKLIRLLGELTRDESGKWAPAENVAKANEHIAWMTSAGQRMRERLDYAAKQRWLTVRLPDELYDKTRTLDDLSAPVGPEGAQRRELLDRFFRRAQDTGDEGIARYVLEPLARSSE
jgi:hypothetical protein